MIRRLALLLAAAVCLAGAARAQEEVGLLAGTLEAVRERGAIRIGYRETALPFSFLSPARQPVGFSIDLCRGIAEDVARTLHADLLEPDAPDWRHGVRIVFVPVPAESRLPMLVDGRIDLECGSTTANAERARTIAFSPVFFLAGTKLLAPSSGEVRSYRDLAGRVVSVGAGTTNADVVRGLATTVSPPISVSEQPNLDAAYAMLAQGQADAFASDDILLAGFAATKPDGHRFQVVGDYLSFEPYALGLRRDDPMFADLVRASFERMAQAGLLKRLYDRWFTDRLPNGATLDLPISAQLSEMFRALGAPD